MTISERDLYDITVIGGGPVGLFAAFYGGLRGARTKIIESLDELGGALTALYPEKYIYDLPGFPKILGRDYVRGAIEQARAMGVDFCLRTTVMTLERDSDQHHFILGTAEGAHYSRTIIISAGIGVFAPKKLDVPGLERFEAGRGVHYIVSTLEDFRDKDVLIVGGGDSAVDWANSLLPLAHMVHLVHRSKFRAHEHAVQTMIEAGVGVYFPDYAVSAVEGNERLEVVTIRHLKERFTRPVKVDELIVAIGFAADLGPLKTWGLEIERNTIKVDKVTMATNIPGIFACGDIVSYPAKFPLIATGVAEAITAVNHCVSYCDPSTRLSAGHSTTIIEKRERAAATASE